MTDARLVPPTRPPRVGVVKPATLRTPAPEVSRGLFWSAKLLPSTSVPARMRELPEKVLATPRVSVPVPAWVKPPAPPTAFVSV